MLTFAVCMLSHQVRKLVSVTIFMHINDKGNKNEPIRNGRGSQTTVQYNVHMYTVKQFIFACEFCSQPLKNKSNVKTTQHEN